MQRLLLFLIFLSFIISAYGQEGRFSGDLMLNTTFYDRDSTRDAFKTPFYENKFYSADAWLTLNYAISGYNFTARFDMFNNSALHNPEVPFTDQGLGFLQVSKEISDLTITGGHFYDQFGSGIIFRAYEDRGLGIDNAVLGLHLQWELLEKITLKGFTGRQKNRLDLYDPIIKGLNAEGYFMISEKVRLAPGAGFINRTLDDKNMNLLVREIENLDVEDRFIPKFNVYATSVYNTFYFGRFSWYVEGAYKTEDAIRDPDGELINTDGSVIYSTLTYSTKGLGITIQGKRTEHFSLRTSPNQTQLDGMINFLPPMSRLSTYRLLSRYAAATQEFGEKGVQLDIIYTPVKGTTISLNFSNITDLNNLQLYREINGEVKLKPNRKLMIIPGIQYLEYNQEVYEEKPGVPMVKAITPFTEISYKLTRRKSIRTELQYQHTDQDFGSWVFGLLEFNVAPKYSVFAADMYNIDPKKTDDLHYYTFGGSYTHNAHKFILSYVKQVKGVVCTGGICRFEPAFSGVKFSLTSTF